MLLSDFWVSPLTLVWGSACSAAVGVGFYGNSETNDGVHQLIYSLDNANHTFSGMDELVRIVGRWLGTGTAHEISKAGTRVPVRSQEPSCTLSSCVMDALGRAAFQSGCPAKGKKFLCPRPREGSGQLNSIGLRLVCRTSEHLAIPEGDLEHEFWRCSVVVTVFEARGLAG